MSFSRGFRCLAPILTTTTLLLLAAGCDDKPAVDTTTAEATVKGTVSAKGEKLTGGSVSFDPANYKRKDVTARKAEIQTDGTYTVKTLAGTNRIVVNSPGLAKARVTMSEQYFEAKPGDNTYDIDLK